MQIDYNNYSMQREGDTHVKYLHMDTYHELVIRNRKQ